ncbi:TPA: hypothetical protein EYP70_03040 [Candidatus Bathyarchaeota archaeon]|nr:hypothetical protein [Candidatus Bathyarchaeota archaeon]
MISLPLKQGSEWEREAFYLLSGGIVGSPTAKSKYIETEELFHESLLRLALKGLSPSQRKILVKLLDCELERYTMSSLAARLADEGIPLSTAKWSLRNLRSLGLIHCGDEERKGIPVRLTSLGRLLAKIAKQDLSEVNDFK